MDIGNILGMVFVFALVQYLLFRQQSSTHTPAARIGATNE
jgi:hypothetical protein